MWICVCIPLLWRTLLHLFSTDSYTIFYLFILKNARMHYFNKPLTGHTARVAMDAVRAHLGTYFIIMVCSHHVPVASTHMIFIYGELSGKRVGSSVTHIV